MNGTTDALLLHHDTSSLPGGRSNGSLPHRVYDTAGWTFGLPRADYGDTDKWMAILALMVFVVAIMLRICKWRRESARWARDMESGDMSSNYGIITVGDKQYCPIPPDNLSVYDTVNSFRFWNNHSRSHQDTVTSIKSLIIQPACGSQYDSVKSYKAFLKKVTENKDLDVEVKELENYQKPKIKSNSEHCVVVEEESEGRSGDIAKLINFLPSMKKQVTESDKKKGRSGERHSIDLPPLFRRRSYSNPTSRRRPATAAAGGRPVRGNIHRQKLESKHALFSSDSEEESHQVFADRRRTQRVERRMYRSTSAGKISREATDTFGRDLVIAKERRRHYSADSARIPKMEKILHAYKKVASCVGVKSLKVGSKSKKHGGSDGVIGQMTLIGLLNQGEGINAASESSENPHSSHSDDDIDSASDPMVSDSDDDTRRNTLHSATSDKTLDNDNDNVFVSLDSGADFGSSSELLQHSPLTGGSWISPSGSWPTATLQLSPHIYSRDFPACIHEEQESSVADDLTSQYSADVDVASPVPVVPQDTNTQKDTLSDNTGLCEDSQDASIRQPGSTGLSTKPQDALGVSVKTRPNSAPLLASRESDQSLSSARPTVVDSTVATSDFSTRTSAPSAADSGSSKLSPSQGPTTNTTQSSAVSCAQSQHSHDQELPPLIQNKVDNVSDLDSTHGKHLDIIVPSFTHVQDVHDPKQQASPPLAGNAHQVKRFQVTFVDNASLTSE